MAFTVRIFGYRGIARFPVSHDGKTFGGDSVLGLEQPYVWRQALSVSGTSTVSTAASVPSGLSVDPTRVLRVEVPDGQSVRYEVSLVGSTVTADANSPLLTGRDQIQFGPGAVIAFLDATGT